MPVIHYVVTLFGTNSYDGLSINTYTFDTEPTSSLIVLISEQSAYQHNLFLSPLADSSPTPSFNLRCYSPNGQVPVPPFTSFAAAHVLFHQHKIPQDKVIIVEDNNRRLEFPRTNGQMQCRVEIQQSWFDMPVGGAERILLMDIFGIVRRDVVLEYAEDCRTLVIYDLVFDKERLRGISPGYSNRRYSRTSVVETLDVDCIVVCVADKRSGGIYVRGLQPQNGYGDVDVPLAVLPYLKNISQFGPNNIPEPSLSMFEIAWTARQKECRLIKATPMAGTVGHPFSDKTVVLMAEATTIQAAQI
ncbi:hypothetical protein J3B02_004078 [Coemansia erecta]|uniref:Uncharacterized protein n=1 Tax=Coemansia asiatica TaxID=1052880 RepID=A0A9W7XJW6_9FUNG|nr:hypothetical protein LPJ64_004323 [Coemansia asiatica]KAJ2847832.1 hypothetical protein J3B02_004078 [Coemansia erecta]